MGWDGMGGEFEASRWLTVYHLKVGRYNIHRTVGLNHINQHIFPPGVHTAQHPPSNGNAHPKSTRAAAVPKVCYTSYLAGARLPSHRPHIHPTYSTLRPELKEGRRDLPAARHHPHHHLPCDEIHPVRTLHHRHARSQGHTA